MKSLILFVASTLMLAAAASAQEATSNTLTPKEAAAGQILLFDGETSFGWVSQGVAEWEMKEDTITPVPGSGEGWLSTTTEFANYRLTADFWSDAIADSSICLRCSSGNISASNAYVVTINDRHDRWPTGSIAGVARTEGRPRTQGNWNRFEILAVRNHLTVRLNGRLVVDTHDPKYVRGKVALHYGGAGVVRFRNLKLQPLGLASIFNGKDLTGWKEIPGHNSVYSVTPEGWLNVNNGNGDLQSEGSYGDFVFQLDILSNGDHLNSGVFFRATPGEFWSGYESQIRNQWMGEDRTRPVDFGTGGIYNLQPSRRVVTNDREWFTMTIVAHGPHMAVWLSGFQVSDFTDTRLPSDNARHGYRAKAGVVSLQGHDPTTDLSLRNLRIAEMPPAAPRPAVLGGLGSERERVLHIADPEGHPIVRSADTTDAGRPRGRP
jgi:hypothetical protein